MSQTTSIGLAAFGSCDGVDVSVDEEVLSTQSRWLLSVQNRNWSLSFEMLNRNSFDQLLNFLRANVGKTAFAELLIGTALGSPVLIIKDGEYPDRFFLKAFGDGFFFEITLTGVETNSFVIAVEQAAEDFGPD